MAWVSQRNRRHAAFVRPKVVILQTAARFTNGRLARWPDSFDVIAGRQNGGMLDRNE